MLPGKSGAHKLEVKCRLLGRRLETQKPPQHSPGGSSLRFSCICYAPAKLLLKSALVRNGRAGAPRLSTRFRDGDGAVAGAKIGFVWQFLLFQWVASFDKLRMRQVGFTRHRETGAAIQLRPRLVSELVEGL